VPDHFDLLPQHVVKDVFAVVVTIAAWENKDSDLHFFSSASDRTRALIPKSFTSIRTDILQ
jgi:hypothetical protein